MGPERHAGDAVILPVATSIEGSRAWDDHVDGGVGRPSPIRCPIFRPVRALEKETALCSAAGPIHAWNPR